MSGPLVFGDLSNRWPVLVVYTPTEAVTAFHDLSLMVNVLCLDDTRQRPSMTFSGPVLLAIGLDILALDWWTRAHQARFMQLYEWDSLEHIARDGLSLRSWLRNNLQDFGLLRPDVLNPYAHFTLLTGPQWRRRGEIPALIWEIARVPNGPVMRWMAHPEQRSVCEREYRRLWGLREQAA
jgi:hypothetical protein